MLPDGYRYLGEGTKTSSGPYSLTVLIFQSDDGAYGYSAEAIVSDLAEYKPARATGAGFPTREAANHAGIEAVQRILEARHASGER